MIEDRARLFEYLRDRLKDGPLELWICWAGDEHRAPEQVLEQGIDEFERCFGDLWELTFVRLSR